MQRALKAAKESGTSHRSHSRGGSDSDHSDGEGAPRRRSESGIPRVRRVSRSPVPQDDEERDSSAVRTRSPAPISTRLKPKTLTRATTADSGTLRSSSGRGHASEPPASGRGRGGRGHAAPVSSSGYGGSSSKTPPRTRPQSTGSYSTSTVSSTSTKTRRSVGSTKD